ncbi:MAG: hypothetical protein H6Q10_2714 [Acidobacteria bacterium]|nr:hypothetical protein [Acidobacteriota bacterium]
MRSASAAVRNNRATFGNPSFSARAAKLRYFWFAWLSPAKASFRLSRLEGMQDSRAPCGACTNRR